VVAARLFDKQPSPFAAIVDQQIGSIGFEDISSSRPVWKVLRSAGGMTTAGISLQSCRVLEIKMLSIWRCSLPCREAPFAIDSPGLFSLLSEAIVCWIITRRTIRVPYRSRWID
jgi:hypothetical protein